MDRNPILFRVDADPIRGWETLYRTAAYASSCQRQRRGIHIMGGIDPFPLVAQVTKGGNDYLPAAHPIGTSEDCDDTMRVVRKLKAAAVVVAGDDIDAGYLRELGSTGTTVISFTTNAAIRFPSKVVVNPFLEPGVSEYEFNRGTQLCVGRRYAVVRGIFRRQRAIRSAEPPAPYRCLLAMGDDDFAGETLKRAQEMLAGSRVEKISAFVRFHNPKFAELKHLASKSGGRLEVLTETNEWLPRLTKGHFAITGGDGWTLEMACLGIPQFVITQAERHVVNAKAIDNEGAALYLGDAEKVGELVLREAINELLDDPLERATMARCAKHLIDGRGLDRMVAALEIMLRQAKPSHARMAA